MKHQHISSRLEPIITYRQEFFVIIFQPGKMNLYCSGAVPLSSDGKKVALVFTPKGNPGFPKGKPKRLTSQAWETDIQTLMRELKEETGISEDQFTFAFPEKCIREYNRKGNLSTVYRTISMCSTKEYPNGEAAIQPEDSSELDTTLSRWYTCEQALDLLRSSRKQVLLEALEQFKLYKEKETEISQ